MARSMGFVRLGILRQTPLPPVHKTRIHLFRSVTHTRFVVGAAVEVVLEEHPMVVSVVVLSRLLLQRLSSAQPLP